MVRAVTKGRLPTHIIMHSDAIDHTIFLSGWRRAAPQAQVLAVKPDASKGDLPLVSVDDGSGRLEARLPPALTQGGLLDAAVFDCRPFFQEVRQASGPCCALGRGAPTNNFPLSNPTGCPLPQAHPLRPVRRRHLARRLPALLAQRHRRLRVEGLWRQQPLGPPLLVLFPAAAEGGGAGLCAAGRFVGRYRPRPSRALGPHPHVGRGGHGPRRG